MVKYNWYVFKIWMVRFSKLYLFFLVICLVLGKNNIYLLYMLKIKIFYIFVFCRVILIDCKFLVGGGGGI